MKKLMTATPEQLQKAMEYHQKKYKEVNEVAEIYGVKEAATGLLLHHAKMIETIRTRILFLQ